MIKCDRAQLSNIEITPDGFLRAKVTFAVPGVLPYLREDGVSFQAKLPEEILSVSTIESARGAPITDGHPADESGKYLYVNTDNYDKFAKGNLSEPRVEFDEKLQCDVGVGLVTVYDPVLIKEILSKEKNEVSIGFEDELVKESGRLNGVSYDSVQRNIKINHLACVESARAGEATRIHVDHKEQKMTDKDTAGKEPREYTYRTLDGSKDIKVDNKDLLDELISLNKKLKVSEEARIKTDASLEEIKGRAGAVSPMVPDEAGSQEKEALMAEVTRLETEIEALAAKLSALEEKYTSEMEAMPGQVDAAAQERVDLIKAADSMGTKCDGLSNREIKLQIIAKAFPFKSGIKTDGVDDEIINARFDAAMEIEKIKNNSYNPERSADRTGPARGDGILTQETVEQKKAAFGSVFENEQTKRSK